MKFVSKLMAATLLLTAFAFAGETKHVDLTFFSDIQVGDTMLKPGDYTVKVEREGELANLTFLRFGKEVATAKAKYQEAKVNRTTLVTDKNGSATVLKGLSAKSIKGSLRLAEANTDGAKGN